MSYSLHIPLWFGVLKIKTIGRLRKEEIDGLVRVWQIGDIYIVWKPAAKKNDVASPPK